VSFFRAKFRRLDVPYLTICFVVWHNTHVWLIFRYSIGFLIGLVLASILMSVIGSGVNTVIVLFAEAPAEFQANYPELSNKMREAWQDAYPGLV